MVLLTACATVDDRLQSAAIQTAKVEAEKTLPDYPADCRRKARSGIRAGEPLDVALIRTDQALGRANARVQRCASWYDEIKYGFARSGDE
ncbi:hypothetical protein [Roseibium sp.]|uniref:hypothetical protein n=1 Tax=Roseibium sp. TaxID=1936156 RepID=UPI0039F0DB41